MAVTRLDSLGRDTRDVLNLIYECEQRGASVTVLDHHVSTRGEMGHVVITVLGMVAQMERRFIKGVNVRAFSAQRLTVDTWAVVAALTTRQCVTAMRARASARSPARSNAAHADLPADTR